MTTPTAARPGPAEACSAAAGLKRRPAHGSVTLSAGASQPQPVKALKEFLPARLESAGRARYLTALFLESCRASPLPDTDVTILLVSELVANAITATAEAMDSGSFTGLQSVVLSLRLFPGRLLVEVIDSSTETPQPKLQEDPDAFNGRGLAVVDRLSQTWGWHWYLQGSRKVVWCQIPNETPPETHLLPRSFPPMNVTQEVATAVVISAWRNHASMTKQVAARLAGELATRPPRSQLESSQVVADKYGVSKTMVDNAKRLLTGAKLVHKAGRRYFTGSPDGL